MKNRKLLSFLIAMLFTLGATVSAQSELISQIPDGIGKQIVSIHSFSSQTKHQEGPANLLIGDANDNEDKWCDNSSEMPWVIFELSEYYDLDKFVITDARVRESSNGNIAAYKIYTTTVEYDADNLDFGDGLTIEGWNTSDWELVVDKTLSEDDRNELSIKTDELTTPKKARYVKFVVTDKGYRFDNGNPENAVRIYGFDIYGTFAQKVDRGNLISVGKTVLGYYNAANKRERPTNIIDGNMTNVNSKWCFTSVKEDEPFRYVVYDLEGQYDMSEFKVYDRSAFGDETTDSNIYGCNIYVSETAPDMSLISGLEDLNTNWTQVADIEDALDIDIKEVKLSTPVKGRFVKLEIPYMKIPADEAVRLYQFEVYGTESAVPANDATLAVLRVAEGNFTPSFHMNTTEYTLDLVKEIESVTISGSASNKNATVTGFGTHALKLGENRLPIVVTSEDGSVTKTYTLIVNRAEKSAISTLESLTAPKGYFNLDFKSDRLEYKIDVRAEVNSIDIVAVPTEANAAIVGAGTYSLNSDETDITVTVTAEDGLAQTVYNITVYKNPENLISVNYGDPKGKRIVNIHSYSNKANDNENPYKLLIGERKNTNGDTGNKWCDNKSGQEPWVVFSLTDIYNIEKIVIRDGRLVEASNSNVANMSYYAVDFSLTGTEEDDFIEVAGDYTSEGDDEIVLDYDFGMNARYIRFRPIPAEGKSTVWIYGFDIYGTKAETVDRGSLVSVGKTIVDFSSNAGDRETPCNLLDGNIEYMVFNPNTGEESLVKNDPWAFNIKEKDAFVIIDLEQEYSNINEFRLYDSADWLKGYKVSLSTDGTTWNEVVSKTFEAEEKPKLDADGNQVFDEETGEPVMETVGPDPKVAAPAGPTRGRYVKVEFPVEMQSDNWNRVREFEVYVGGVESIDSVEANKALSIFPNPVKEGEMLNINAEGVARIYSLQGSLMSEQYVNGTISTNGLPKGTYIVEVRDNETKENAKAKLIVQ
ncbi:discoidin domain-containing protein [Bacteroidales bacterium OttesenSCG-928-I14]|nr:discoidin domain-containing protein [Bacteroidales bacterium OttesenSCG-928-I14]